MSVTEQLRFEDVQKCIDDIYSIHNDRYYSTSDLAGYLVRSSTMSLKIVRKQRYDQMANSFLNVLGWLLAIGNRIHIDAGSVLSKHFPGACPYCGERICMPVNHGKGRLRFDQLSPPPSDATLFMHQQMLALMYPNNTLIDSAQHLVEETAELSAALTAFSGTHDMKFFADVELEFADVMAHICAVATCCKIDLAHATVAYYKNGCRLCKNIPCCCLFSETVSAT